MSTTQRRLQMSKKKAPGEHKNKYENKVGQTKAQNTKKKRKKKTK